MKDGLKKSALTGRMLCLALVFGLMFGMTSLWADTHEHEEAGISIWFPDDWTIKIQGDSMQVEAPDQDAFADLIVVRDAESVEDGLKAYEEMVRKNIKNFKITSEGENVKINGLTVHYLEGEGVMEGEDVESSASVFITPKKALMLMITINTEESNKKYEKEFEKIVNSIRAI